MATSAVFPRARTRAKMYESFYLRAVSPEQPVGVWIRHTVGKRRGELPIGSVWCTVFDAHRGRPFMHRLTGEKLSVPAGGWIEVGSARLTPTSAEGECGAAAWSLRFASEEPELRHLPREWLYRTPLPRTKLTSPAPAARFDGVLELSGQNAIELDGWRGMVGHNWGSEHAERWIWLHGVGFKEQPEAWLDVALGRLKVAGRMTPWMANGALSLDGRRYCVGGLAPRGLDVAETSTGCALRLTGENGLEIRARAEVPEGAGAQWRYADPDDEDRSEIGQPTEDAHDRAPHAARAPALHVAHRGAHDVINCSVAALELTVRLPGQRASRTLRTAHGGAYELGIRSPI
jgi:hypothetical protein